jgi:hypothetical protein
MGSQTRSAEVEANRTLPKVCAVARQTGSSKIANNNFTHLGTRQNWKFHRPKRGFFADGLLVIAGPKTWVDKWIQTVV